MKNELYNYVNNVISSAKLYHVDRLAFKECADVVGGHLNESATGFNGRPGYVGRDVGMGMLE